MVKVYAAYHKNPDEVEKSSSGGMFILLADYVLSRKGIVVAAKYDYATQTVYHEICKTRAEVDACRGSKYIQSSIGKKIYDTVSECLKEGRVILYCGTPCQIAAINQFVFVKKLDASLLITCEILCHGVGSPGIWNKYAKEKNFNNINFKDKRNGWKNPICIGNLGNKERTLRKYSWLYFSNAIMRPSCYACPYTSTKRNADFTIGDYWKVIQNTPEMYNPRGTSVIMVNSNKAVTIFDSISQNLIYKEINIDSAIQNCMKKPTEKSRFHNRVMADYRKYSTELFFGKWFLKLLLFKVEKIFRKK